MERFDIIIIGAGIAGASVAYELSSLGSVVVLEMEEQPGSHSTGRSAAFFSQTYGNAIIRALTTGSKDFLTQPPSGFSNHDILRPSGALFIARQDQMAQLDEHYAAVHELAPNVERCDVDFATNHVPILRHSYLAGCVWEPDSQAIDVHELLSGFLRGTKSMGGKVQTKAAVEGLTRANGTWIARTDRGEFAAPIVVNAAGAWADNVAELAGLPTIGLTPMRRTVCAIEPPETVDISSWPLVIDIDEQFYFKPNNKQLWLSPADETPMPPCDVYTDDMDIAIAVDRFEKATTLNVTRITHDWAGLRTFTADRTPVVGFDPLTEGFFWLAGQGGYGIQSSPAMARLAASLAQGQDIPADLRELGITSSTLAPERFRT